MIPQVSEDVTNNAIEQLIGKATSSQSMQDELKRLREYVDERQPGLSKFIEQAGSAVAAHGILYGLVPAGMAPTAEYVDLIGLLLVKLLYTQQEVDELNEAFGE